MPTVISTLFAALLLHTISGDRLSPHQSSFLDSPEVRVYAAALQAIHVAIPEAVLVIIDQPTPPTPDCDPAAPREPGWSIPASCRTKSVEVIPPASAAARSLGFRAMTVAELIDCQNDDASCRLPRDTATVVINVGRALVSAGTARVMVRYSGLLRTIDLSLREGRWVATPIRCPRPGPCL